MRPGIIFHEVFGLSQAVREEDIFLLLGIGFCLTTIAYLALSQRQRDLLYSQLRIRGRKVATASTPPRSLSPEKSTPSNAPPVSTEYVDSFPPSRRQALIKIAETLPAKQKESIGELEIDQELFSHSILPFAANWSECSGSKYTPTGFSVDEIKALGDFPDYAELSGVPLPSPYHEFDIDKALARPYRPFRWAYHQTMCTLSICITAYCRC